MKTKFAFGICLRHRSCDRDRYFCIKEVRINVLPKTSSMRFVEHKVNKVPLYLERNRLVIQVQSMTKPSQCGIDEMKDCDEGNQVDDDVRQKLDGHSGSVACGFYNIMLCTKI